MGCTPIGCSEENLDPFAIRLHFRHVDKQTHLASQFPEVLDTLDRGADPILDFSNVLG